MSRDWCGDREEGRSHALGKIPGPYTLQATHCKVKPGCSELKLIFKIENGEISILFKC